MLDISDVLAIIGIVVNILCVAFSKEIVDFFKKLLNIPIHKKVIIGISITILIILLVFLGRRDRISSNNESESGINHKLTECLEGITGGNEWTFCGEVANGVPHGRGRMEFESGYFDGYFYNGHWLNGLRRYTEEGAHYYGSFIFNDETQSHDRHGRGRISYANGSYYYGYWHYNRRHGQGEAFCAVTGNSQSGNWIDGAFQG